ncbi:eCIS core domain-containing protein [Moorena bouillonii]|uniref:DUF4157 domain-containing protein n=1 Tax=Moorena bouillonii PNG TaxID=568701 RepID=A0A1U7N158_9CYAN|nr:DUF4157 domain-containing protein [Moorena bouillonii]OLT59687.1 hypothetical protein BJP37_12245 [Moorena bouillonii PNG]
MGYQRASQTKNNQTTPKGKTVQAKPTPLGTHSPVHPMLQLQRKLGNQAVNRLIQTKMQVGEPDDVYEKEADSVAAQVMRMPAPSVQNSMEEEEVQTKPIALQLQSEEEEIQTKPIGLQLQSDEEEIQTKPIALQLQSQEEEIQTKPIALQLQSQEEEIQTKPIALQLQSQEEEIQTKPYGLQLQSEEEEIQTKANPGQTPTVSPNLETKIQSRRGTGQPLPENTRSFMASRFGNDFSGVKVHTDSIAASAAQELNAQAFTTGQDIFFGSGYYEPHTTKGKTLLAHELTHTIQQQPSVAGSSIQGREGMNDSETATISPTAPAPAPSSPTSVPPPTTTTQPPEVTVTATSPEATAAPPAITEQTTASVSAEAPPESVTPQPAGETGSVGVELLMPEPPSELSPEAQNRLAQVQSNAATAAATESELPSAEANVASARSAVTEPEEETSARAGEALVEALGERPQPSPEIEALCQRIYQIIRSKRPPDEESLVDADPTEAAQEAGGELNQSIQSNIEQVESSYDQLDQQPEGTAQQQPQALEVPPETVETPEINAEAAVPDPVTPEAVSLDADVAASSTRMEEAGMNTEAAQLVETGPIAEARAAQGELQETAQRDPAEVLAEQQEALANASSDMAALQEAALNALATSRASTVGGVHSQQTEMVGSEEQMRTQISAQAQGIFAHAQNQVNTLLTPLSQTAMNRWETGAAVLSEQFRQSLSRVKRWVDERHESTVLAVVDYFTGLPDWVTEEYDKAEQAFGDGVCNLIREISAEVNGVIATCEAIIDQARQEINNLFTNLPAELQEWAASEQERFNAQLDGLHQQVMSTRDNFNSDLANRAAQSVQEVRQEIHELREAAGGLIGRVVNAVNQFLEDPAKFIIEGLLALVGIAASAFWAVVNRIGDVIDDIAENPLGFAENLLAAIGQGFAQFFDKIGSYLLDGLLEWLFSGLGAVGVQIPSDFSLSSVITFFLELMGITWERIRGLLARHIGEENIALIEQAYELIADLITMGPQGIFEMIKEQLDPQNILDMVMQSAIDFLQETLIAQVSVRVLAMFNPVGAIVQAIEVIYKVLKWIFENAARIFSLVETVVNGMADIIAGNVSGMANAVEQALARLVVPVIDFFAGLVNLGNLPDRIADTIRGFQEWVEGILERVIAWLAERARALLRSLGIGGEEDDQVGPDGQLSDVVVGETINFTGGNENHRIYVSVSGSEVELMVASSRPLPLSSKLTEWESSLSTLASPQQQQASALIATVRSQYNIVVKEGEEANQAISQAQRTPNENTTAQAQQQDNEVEAAERSITPELGELFDIFEGGIPFQPIEETIQLEGGTDRLSIRPGNRGNLDVFVKNSEITSLFVSIISGPLGNAIHNHGTILAESIADNIDPQLDEIRSVHINDGRVASSSLELLNSHARTISQQLSRFGPAMKAPSLSRLLSLEPIQRYRVGFNQQMGNHPTIIAEYDRQLHEQEIGLNAITLDQWIVNRNAYSLNQNQIEQIDSDERETVLRELRERALAAQETARGRKPRFQQAADEVERALENPEYIPNFNKLKLVTNRFGNERAWRRQNREGIAALLQQLRSETDDWKLIFKRAAVLHNADQIAGGFGTIPNVNIVPRPSENDSDEAWQNYLQQLRRYVGSSRINSGIGSLWRTKIDALEDYIRSNYQSQGWSIWRMNVELSRE